MSESSRLTLAQQQVHDQLLSWCTSSSSHPAAVLKGYAGVGKTFLAHVLIRSLIEEEQSVGVVAPTHKAVKVLNKTALQGVVYKTAHAMLALKEKINFYTGAVSYEEDPGSKYAPPVATCNVLIFDECSMLNNELFMKLVPWMKRGLKVVFMGDPCQIPPVGQKDSIPFLKAEEWNMLRLELTEIIRQKQDNPILEYATAIRSSYKNGSFPPAEKMAGDTGIRLVNKTQEKELFQIYFGSEAFRQDPDYMKVIGWRNKTVDSYNKDIRRVLYGTHVPALTIGEKLVMEDRFNLNSSQKLLNNQEMEVTGLEEDSRSMDYFLDGEDRSLTVQLYQATVSYTEEGKDKLATIPIIHDSSKAAFQQLLKGIEKEARRAGGSYRKQLWKTYYSLHRSVAWVNYNYALTAHKSQGSTYDNCLVLKWDLDANWEIEERNRILYTSCTRPRYLLMIEP